MRLALLSLLPALAAASPLVASISVEVEPKRVINGTVEYQTECKSCPYDLCTNVETPWGGDNVTLTCWTYGTTHGDSELWLKTTDNCYVTEYDLVEYAGDFSEELAFCGRIPENITYQPARVRYLSECKWGYSTSDTSIAFYGRDQDITVTCWVVGQNIMNESYWYKTTDNCEVSGSGLWWQPDQSKLQNCGPAPGNQINETAKRDLHLDVLNSALLNDPEPEPEPEALEEGTDLFRRWLQPEQIGEEYAYCHSCATAASSDTCTVTKVYEYNQTVVSQCYANEMITFPNGSFQINDWMLTTDWCYVNATDFWVPPYDNYRYPSCENWPGY